MSAALSDPVYSGLLAPDPTAANASALGAPKPKLQSVSSDPVAAPKKSETDVTTAKQKPLPWEAAPPELKTNMDAAFSGIHKGESGGGSDMLLQNINAGSGEPNSSASGPLQIEKGTYVGNARKYFPAETQGKSDEDIWSTRVDPEMYKRVSDATMWVNAQTLTSNKIPPTAPNLTLAWRAGGDGAVALIRAASTNPNALAGDIVPDLRTRGNGGAGNLTVGQLLTNPYAHGPGGDNETPATLFALNLGHQILNQEKDDLEKGRARVAKIDADYKPVEVPAPPAPPETDPLKQFSSLAGLFAIGASLFSRTPATAAMNGLAGAMNAAKKSDWETYAAHYEQYKTASKQAIEAQELHSKNISEALEMMTKNMAAGTTMLNTALTLAGDEENLKRQHVLDWAAIGKANDEMRERAAEWKLKQPVYDAAGELSAANQGYTQALQTGDQDQISKWASTVKQKQTAFDQASENLRQVEQAEKGATSYPKGANEPVTLLRSKIATAMRDEQSARDRGDSEAEQEAHQRVVQFQEQLKTQATSEKPATASAAGISGLTTMLVDGKPALVRYDKNKAQVQYADGTPVQPGTAIGPAPKAAAAGSPGEERTRRFNEMKAAQEASGTYTDDTTIYHTLDRQMAEDKQTAISDEAAKMAADIALKTGHPPAWMGRSQASLTKFLDTYAKEAHAQGLGPDEIAANQVKFAGEMAEARTLGTMSARVDFGAKELDVALPQAMEASERVYRPGFKKVADIQQAIQGQTSDPDLLEFAQFNQQVISAYAQMMGRGGLSTVHAMDRAEGLLSTATSQTGYVRQLDTLHKEVQTILYGTQAAKDSLRQEIGDPRPGAALPVLTGVPRAGDATAAAPKENDITTSKSGRPIIFRNGQWEYRDAGSR